jgi:hypothetical protein
MLANQCIHDTGINCSIWFASARREAKSWHMLEWSCELVEPWRMGATTSLQTLKFEVCGNVWQGGDILQIELRNCQKCLEYYEFHSNQRKETPQKVNTNPNSYFQEIYANFPTKSCSETPSPFENAWDINRREPMFKISRPRENQAQPGNKGIDRPNGQKKNMQWNVSRRREKTSITRNPPTTWRSSRPHSCPTPTRLILGTKYDCLRLVFGDHTYIVAWKRLTCEIQS